MRAPCSSTCRVLASENVENSSRSVGATAVPFEVAFLDFLDLMVLFVAVLLEVFSSNESSQFSGRMSVAAKRWRNVDARSCTSRFKL